jgi:FHS family glucose/mannose:H+ symporter-like MFS transporter
MPSSAPRPSPLLNGIACAGMFVFGIVMALLGAVVPVLSERLAFGLGDVGTLFLSMNAAMLAASLLVGPTIDRFGMKLPLGLGALLVAVALGAIPAARKLGALLAAVAALGFGGGVLNATTNTLVADLHDDPDRKASALNLLGVFFGFGALFLPFSLGAWLSRLGLSGVMFAAAALCAATGLVALAVSFPAAKQAQGWPLAEMRRLLRMPLVVALALLLFFESGNEFLLGGYFATFLSRDLGVPIEAASYVLAGFWAAIMTSRVLLSRALLRFSAHRIVLGSALLAAGGALAVAAAPRPPLAIAGIVLTGLALAGIFPTVLGLAAAAYREYSGTVFGLLFTVALTGGMTVPWLAGHLAERSGLRSVFLLAAVSFLAVVALNEAARGARR